MDNSDTHPLMQRLVEHHDSLTPKGRILGDYILKNPRRVVFMTTKELAGVCDVSEATVVRFVSQLDYAGYSEFIQELRDLVDTELTLLDRFDLSELNGHGPDRLGRIISEEIDNLRQLYESVDIETVERMVDQLNRSPQVFVVGSRLSYTLAYYMGWSLIKVRGNVQILKGSDRTTIDWLTIAPPDSLVVIIATSRYPNELIRIGKLARRLNLDLHLITDTTMCPIIQFADLSLVSPSRHIPYIGTPTTLSCLIYYLINELVRKSGDNVKLHQAKLEQAYLENDILFNLLKDIS